MDKYTILDKYFEGTLSSEEKKEFEFLKKSDTDFKKEFEFQKDLKKAITEERKEFLKKELQVLEKNNFGKQTSNKLVKIYGVAASIIILLFVGSYFLFNSLTNSPEELFNTHFTPYRNVINPIVRGEIIEDIEFKAFLNYENKRFDKALPLLDSAYVISNKSHLLLYKSNCLLSLNKPEESLKTLQKYIVQDEVFLDKAYWYMALSNLKLKNKKEAKVYLEKLISLNSYKKEEALAILKKL